MGRKIWIAGAVLFALIVLVYTFFARQEWSATAITDRPTVNMLGVTIPNSSSYAIWILKPISFRSTSLPHG
jgi:LPS O-antigen subunit length determinant protein (WzzB/FepE family)